jgi:hypothetical protein
MRGTVSPASAGTGTRIDWSRPWLDGWRALGAAVEQDWASGLPLAEALNRAGPSPVRFVPQTVPLSGMDYERRIHAGAECPTREGLHDFFNGLCWLRFPQTKSRLNALQAAELARHEDGKTHAPGRSAGRGPVRDALTVFDENAALMHAPPAIWQALAAREWHTLFVTLRPCWSQVRLVLFGHALLEKLVHPRKPITAHVYRVDPGDADPQDWDGAVAATLDAQVLRTKPFLPLPVLGVPGWWPANEDAAFYDDPQVFRALRAERQ